jgi:epoxide hydrolase-like predicted phosphatase
MRCRAVIFDFGGVFVDSPFAAVEAAAARLGVDPGRLVDTVFGTYDQDTDHPWHRLERGELPFDDARERIGDAAEATLGVRVDPVELLLALGGGGVRDAMVEFCRSARSRGVATGLLTNNAAEFAPFWRPLLPLEELFDDVVDSSEVGLRKPDPRIYELALSRLGVDAPQAAFVDDAPGNVAGARSVGLHAVLIGPDRADEPAAIAALEALLGP